MVWRLVIGGEPGPRQIANCRDEADVFPQSAQRRSRSRSPQVSGPLTAQIGWVWAAILTGPVATIFSCVNPC